jgi:ribosomal protein L15
MSSLFKFSSAASGDTRDEPSPSSSYSQGSTRRSGSSGSSSGSSGGAGHGGGSPDSVRFKEEDVRNLTEFFPSKGRHEVIAALRLARGHTGTAAEILSSEAPQTLENLNNVRESMISFYCSVRRIIHT